MVMLSFLSSAESEDLLRSSEDVPTLPEQNVKHPIQSETVSEGQFLSNVLLLQENN